MVSVLGTSTGMALSRTTLAGTASVFGMSTVMGFLCATSDPSIFVVADAAGVWTCCGASGMKLAGAGAGRGESATTAAGTRCGATYPCRTSTGMAPVFGTSIFGASTGMALSRTTLAGTASVFGMSTVMGFLCATSDPSILVVAGAAGAWACCGASGMMLAGAGAGRGESATTAAGMCRGGSAFVCAEWTCAPPAEGITGS